MDNKKIPKNPVIFCCEKCNYNTGSKKDFNKHLSTLKHKNRINDNKITKNNNSFICETCNKEYCYLSGLLRHKKKCNFISNKKNIEIENTFDDNNTLDSSNIKLELTNDLIMKILNDNQEMRNIIVKQQEQISELIPKVGNNNNNTQNNKFNIQVFLNEQCKDAINMSDFIKSLHITIDQLDFTKQNGLAQGLSKSIIDNMSKLSIYQRPMHCTDTKRETLYIKDDNNWSKEGAKEKLKNVINKASSKNYNALMEWKTLNPDYMNNEDKTDYFTKTISTIGKPTSSIDDKVIKLLCKEIYVN
jgi:hypothetical protein